MSFFSKKFVALFAGMTLIAGPALAVSYQATATRRPSVVAGRMPSINGIYYPSTGTSTTTTLTQQELIELYLECLRGSDACGTNFEECTTKSLFYGKKTQCASQLLLMPSAGINTLYGIGNTTSLSARSTTDRDENGEWAYLYPTDGSLLGSLIEGARADNRLATQDCVRNYQRCLTKEDVCGTDFELCTSSAEFKTQKLFCASTLARCGDEGKEELFGSINTTGNPTASSRLGILIAEGAELAAVNAVATCYKVVDNCFINACSGNPYKCKEGAEQSKVCSAADVINPETGDPYCATQDIMAGGINRNAISGFLKNECLDTIGANKYCYATVNGKMPTGSQIQDEDNKADVYSSLFGSRFNAALQTKIDDLIARFDRSTKNKCQETIVSCAMSSCGGGSGAACYASAFGNNGKGVTSTAAREEIKFGCEHIVNNDRACQYVASVFDTVTGSWDWAENSIFDALFTAPDDIDVRYPDPTNAVADLNSKLALSYSEGALDQMRIQCQAVAQSCVKSMCGNEYTNCYRNRTDVASSVGNMPGSDARRNQAGGVLDRSIVIGLCINTVKDNQICAEHLRAEIARGKAAQSTSNLWGNQTAMWGNNAVANAWVAGGAVQYGAQVQSQARDSEGNALCLKAAGSSEYGRCDDASGEFTVPYMVGSDMFYTIRAEDQIFATIISNMELEAQAIYKGKITQQQNQCMAANATGGIMGNADLGGTFQWVKLSGARVPSGYGINGLASNQFRASNDLYGSFCRIRIELKSSDEMLNAAFRGAGQAYVNGKAVGVPNLSDYAVTYYAAGDAFTCGSWIPSDRLGQISDAIAKSRYDSNANFRTRNWMTIGAAVLGGVGGAIGMNALQNKTGLGGLLGTTERVYADSDIQLREAADRCVTDVQANMTLVNQNAGAQFVTNAPVMVGDAAAMGALNWTTFRMATATDTGTRYSAAQATATLNNALTRCQNTRNTVVNRSSGTTTTNQTAKTLWNLGGAVVGGAVAGTLAWQATRSVQKANAEGEAAEWYNEIGNHIKCYIGAEEVGSFGDVISTEME